MKKYYFFAVCSLILTLGGVFFFHYIYNLRLLGHLYVNVSDTNATILLNDQEIGQTPLIDHQAPAGYYQLTIQTNAYSYTTTIRLSPQTATIIDWQAGQTAPESSGVIYELLPLPADSSDQTQVIVNTIPDRALLTFSHHNSENFSPAQIPNLPPQEQNLTVSLPGYLPLTLEFTPQANYQLHLQVKLSPQDN